jgi:hypothetical protein
MQANPDKFQVLAVGYLFGIFLRTKMPGQRSKVKITKNKSMENCKFV